MKLTITRLQGDPRWKIVGPKGLPVAHFTNEESLVNDIFRRLTFINETRGDPNLTESVPDPDPQPVLPSPVPPGFQYLRQCSLCGTTFPTNDQYANWCGCTGVNLLKLPASPEE